MLRVFSTSTMNSPPLEVWVTGSLGGGVVSAANSFGPGTAAVSGARSAATWALAATVGVTAAAPASAAPLRKLRRAVRGRSRDFLDIGSALGVRETRKRKMRRARSRRQNRHV